MQTLTAPHTISKTDLIKQLDTHAQSGLTVVEAKKRLQEYGYNQLEQHQSPSLFRIFIAQFISPLVWVLAFAAGLAFVFQEWLEGVAIIGVIFINAGIGFFMEKQAIKSMDALRKLVQTYARVFRDGILQQVPTIELVPGERLRVIG